MSGIPRQRFWIQDAVSPGGRPGNSAKEWMMNTLQVQDRGDYVNRIDCQIWDEPQGNNPPSTWATVAKASAGCDAARRV